MKIAELIPLLQQVAPLQDTRGGRDIYEEVLGLIERANTPTMGQSVCSHVICMCNPKAWGDRVVEGMSDTQWNIFLGDLVEVANSCGQAIYNNHSASKRNG